MVQLVRQVRNVRVESVGLALRIHRDIADRAVIYVIYNPIYYNFDVIPYS